MNKVGELKELFSGVGKKRTFFSIVMFLALVVLTTLYFNISDGGVARTDATNPINLVSDTSSGQRTLASSDGCYYVNGIYVCSLTPISTASPTPTPVVVTPPTPTTLTPVPSTPTPVITVSPTSVPVVTLTPIATPKATATPTSKLSSSPTSTPRATSNPTEAPTVAPSITPAVTPDSNGASSTPAIVQTESDERLAVPDEPRIPNASELKALQDTAPYQLKEITKQDFQEIMQSGNTYDILVLWQFTIRHPRLSGMSDEQYLDYQVECFNQELKNQWDSQLVDWWLSGYKKDIAKQNANQLFVSSVQSYKNGVINYNNLSSINDTIVDQISNIDTNQVKNYKDSVALTSSIAKEVAGSVSTGVNSSYFESIISNTVIGSKLSSLEIGQGKCWAEAFGKKICWPKIVNRCKPCPKGQTCLAVCIPESDNESSDESSNGSGSDNGDNQLIGDDGSNKNSCVMPPCPQGAKCMQVCPTIVNSDGKTLYNSFTQENKSAVDKLVNQESVMKMERILGIPTGKIVSLSEDELKTVKGEYANTCAPFDEADRKAKEAISNGGTEAVSISGFASCVNGLIAW